MQHSRTLILAGLLLTAPACRQRVQSITPVAVAAKVYEGTGLKAPVIQLAQLGEVYRSPFLSGQKEGDVPTWWSVETRNGVGVAHGADFAVVPMASERRYVQAETPLLAAPNARATVVRTLPPGEPVEMALRPPVGSYVLLVANGVGTGFVDKSQLDTTR